MAAQVVEAEPARGLRPDGELLLDAGQLGAGLAGELQLDEVRPRIRRGDGEWRGRR